MQCLLSTVASTHVQLLKYSLELVQWECKQKKGALGNKPSVSSALRRHGP